MEDLQVSSCPPQKLVGQRIFWSDHRNLQLSRSPDPDKPLAGGPRQSDNALTKLKKQFASFQVHQWQIGTKLKAQNQAVRP